MASPGRPNVFEFRSYKAYVRAWIESRPNRGHGEKSKIAKKLKCHIAYVSQVLNAHSHLSPEQADMINAYFGHNESEAEYFMVLVHRGRAGTHSLESFFDRKINHLLDQRALLRNRIADKKMIGVEDQAIYYSAWHYAAIHMGVLVPELRSSHALAEYFGLGIEKVRSAIDFLVSVGLIRENHGALLPGESRIHLTDDSPMISKHHVNWRMQAILSLDRESVNDLHYSSVVSVSRDDTPRVREIMLKAIEEVRGLTKESADERICCYALDLFAVGGHR